MLFPEHYVLRKSRSPGLLGLVDYLNSCQDAEASLAGIHGEEGAHQALTVKPLPLAGRETSSSVKWLSDVQIRVLL